MATREALEAALEGGLRMGAEFLDIRVEDARASHVRVADGRTREVVAPREAGAGVRAFVDGAWGFSTTNRLDRRGLTQAAGEAARMARAAAKSTRVHFKLPEGKAWEAQGRSGAKLPVGDVAMEERVSLALELDKDLRRRDKRIVSTQTSYDDLDARITIANSWGTFVEVPEEWVLVNAVAWAAKGGLRVRGRDSRGGFGGFEVVEREGAREAPGVAAGKAIRLLSSKAAPAGKFPCIFDPVLTGVFAHEAFGHAAEADLVLGGSSVLEGRIGQRVGPEEVSIFDDPTLQGTFGYFEYDWEGSPARRRVLVKDGVLRGYIHSLETAARLGMPPNGGARSDGYQSPPIVRMSNTFFGAGTWNPAEMMKDMGRGLYLKGMQYGYTDPAKGQFMFKCEEAFAVEEGEPGQVYRDCSLSGLTLEVLSNIDALGKDLLVTDPGYCGKNGQSMRTTDGGPHLRVKNIVVGGLA